MSNLEVPGCQHCWSEVMTGDSEISIPESWCCYRWNTEPSPNWHTDTRRLVEISCDCQTLIRPSPLWKRRNMFISRNGDIDLLASLFEYRASQGIHVKNPFVLTGVI